MNAKVNRRKHWRNAAAALLLLVGVSLAAACSAPPPSEPDVAIFLLRHAEKATNDPKDPDLSGAGRARAEALATLLEHAGVTHLLSTDLKRTQQTLAPLAAKCGRTVDTFPAAAMDRQIAALLTLPPGSVAVVAGHSNTIPAIARALGGTVLDLEHGPAGDVLPDAEYGRLLLIVRPSNGAAPRTFRLQCGEATPGARPGPTGK